MSKVQDLTGLLFGKLKVIKRVEDYIFPNGDKHVQWLCQCECGNEKKTLGKYLKNGTVKSCGCLKRNKNDLTGLRFGKLLVLNRNEKTNHSWDCLCECGNRCVVNTSELQSGKTKSCGCLRKEVAYNMCKKQKWRFNRIGVEIILLC